MYLLGKRVEELTSEDIKRLIESSVQEHRGLDYKKELKLGQDRDKKEFLFDVSAMCNTEGGCLVFGIEESKDEKGQNTGSPSGITGIDIDNYDKLFQQIEDTVRANTDPNISTLALKHLIVDGKNVLIIGVPKTYSLPIMVTFNETNKFYKRRNSGKYAVDVYELNQMFLQNQILKESAEQFREQRITKVKAGKVLPILATGSYFFLHLIPFSFQRETILDLTNASNMSLSTNMRPMYSGGWDTMFNADGFATFALAPDRQNILSYDQLFRTGIYEAYTGQHFDQQPSQNGAPISYLYGTQLIKEVLEKTREGLAVLRRFNIDAPFIFSISLVGIKGFKINSERGLSRPFLTEDLLLPFVVLPTYDADISNLLKPVFDIIWQGAAYSQSPAYTINR